MTEHIFVSTYVAISTDKCKASYFQRMASIRKISYCTHWNEF